MPNIDPSHFRPLGNRVLVKRLPLADQSVGGISVIGRDYPTMGTILAPFGANGLRCQWTIDANYDLKLIGDDLLLLDYDQLNLVSNIRGDFHAVGDRVMVEPLGEYGARRTELVYLKGHLTTQWSHGRVTSVGAGKNRWRKAPVYNDVVVGDIALFQPKAVTEVKLNHDTYWIIRNDDIVATLED